MKIKSTFAALLLGVFALIPSAWCATTNLTALLQQGLFEEQANRNLDAAIASYQTLATQFDQDRQLAATAVFRLGECYRAQGKTNEAAAQYQRILRDFSDQKTLAALSQQDLTGMDMVQADNKKPIEHSGGASAEASSLGAQISGIENLKSDPEEQARAALAIFPDESLKAMLLQMPKLRLQENLFRTNQVLTDVVNSNPTVQPAGLDGYTFAVGGEHTSTVLSWKDKNGLNIRSFTQSELRKQIAWISERVDFIVGIQKARLKVLQSAAGFVAADNVAQLNNGSVVIDEEAAEIQRIQAMIQNSPDLVNALNGQSGTLLCVAAQKGQLRVAQFLLEHGADVQRGYPLTLAAGNGHKAMMELLLKNGAPVNAAESDSQTALHRAAARGYVSVTEALLAAKADVNIQAEHGRTPLTVAVENGAVPVAATLLAHGADPNIICRQRQNWAQDRTSTGAPLHFALARGDEAMVSLLLTNGADLKLRSPLGESPLDIAATLGKPGVVRELLAAGADVNATANPGLSPTPLHLATSGGHQEIVEMLLERGADPNIRAVINRNGVTPLMTAAGAGNSKIVSLLLKHKADPNLADANGDVALLFAIQNKNPATVRALLAGGANPNALDGGYPLLVMAVTQTENTEITAALIDAKADVNLTDKDGKAPLHWAAERNRKDLIPLLIKAGADVNLRTKNGATPLDCAKSADASGVHISGGRLLGTPPPLSYQWRNSIGQTAPTNAMTATDLLRQNGALDELPDFTRIRITRQGLAQPVQVFLCGTTVTNQFTLLESVMQFYSLPTVYAVPGEGGRAAWMALPFPDFARVSIRRPSQKIGGKEQEIKVSLLNRSNVVDCAQDVPVQFGDVIEIPESVHALDASTPNPVREMERSMQSTDAMKGIKPSTFAERLQAITEKNASPYLITAQCLQKSVQFVVAGETKTFKVNSWKEGFLSSALGKTEARSALRSTSDLSRVKVMRKNNSSKPDVFIVDDSSGSPNPDDLWLQEGDVIEVPDKQ